MSKSKVQLRVNSYPHKRGDVVEVDAETAEFLIREGHGVKPEPQSKKD